MRKVDVREEAAKAPDRTGGPDRGSAGFAGHAAFSDTLI